MINLRSPWINVVAATVGGLALGIGIGRLLYGITIAASVLVVIGLVLLWWSFSDREKTRPGSPESEANGSHTVE
jgi:undecaprenyl pyrophosphate phosphatase UppP